MQIAINKREMPYDVNEAMKLLRTNLQFCGKDKKVIMITSTLADEGKSTVALNLCRSLAQLGSRVILIDADMRKSVMADRYAKGEKSIPGLSHLLSARNGLEDVLVENVHATNTGNPIFIRLGHRGGTAPGTLRNVTVRNVFVEMPFGIPDIEYDLRGPGFSVNNPRPSSITGIPGHQVDNITLENVEIVYPSRASKGIYYYPLQW